MSLKINWSAVIHTKGYKALRAAVNKKHHHNNQRKQKGWTTWYDDPEKEYRKVIGKLIHNANIHGIYLHNYLISLWLKFESNEHYKSFFAYCHNHIKKERLNDHPCVKPSGIRSVRKYYKEEVKRAWCDKAYATKRIVSNAQCIARQTRTKKKRCGWTRKLLT